MTKDNYLLRELYRLLDDYSDFNHIHKGSVINAIKFLNEFIIPRNIQNPTLEIHPDNQVAFTYRKQGVGIVNIAFNPNGTVTWAGFKDKENKKMKGRFHIGYYIDNKLEDLIKFISRGGSD